ncbi:sensor histidine kinase [Bacillus sp. 1P06AnD]|uniref:sensor histidine kinase n=1 Tax=Bacillus sp. 1P06AnD TaxID=3132208 RepID=UPI0039A0AFAA
MKSISIVWKLSILTFIVLVSFFGILLFSQTLFFEKFYIYHKGSELEKQLREAKKGIARAPGNEEVMAAYAGQFMEKNNATFNVVRDIPSVYPINPYRIKIRTEGEIKLLILTEEGMSLDRIPNRLKAGDKIIADGFYMDEQDKVMDPVQVQLDDGNTAELPEGLSRTEGTVVELNLPKNQSFNSYYQDSLSSNILLSISAKKERIKELDKGEKVQVEWQDNVSGIHYVVVLLPLSLPDGSPQYVMAYTSIQPVDEAIETMKQYYIYLAGAGVIVLFLLSYFYSKMVARPLVSLNKVAGHLANLDFDVHMPKRKKDEIGELSESMQSMANQLKTTLGELKAANEQLQLDILRKQQTEQLRKEFTANVSHELKTPLGIIRGFTEGLQDGIAEKKKERYLNHILHEVERMDEMVLDLLQLSKYEANVMKLDCQSFLLAGLLDDVIDLFGVELEERKLYIDCQSAGTLAVYADEKKISQVFINILSNAIRHASPNTAIKMMVIDHGGQIEIQIENRGNAIPENRLDRIWDQFYRIDPSRDRKIGGTGLGLAIVSQILQLHGCDYGVINIENGVRFYFYLEKGDVMSDEPN